MPSATLHDVRWRFRDTREPMGKGRSLGHGNGGGVGRGTGLRQLGSLSSASCPNLRGTWSQRKRHTPSSGEMPWKTTVVWCRRGRCVHRPRSGNATALVFHTRPESKSPPWPWEGILGMTHGPVVPSGSAENQKHCIPLPQSVFPHHVMHNPLIVGVCRFCGLWFFPETLYYNVNPM